MTLIQQRVENVSSVHRPLLLLAMISNCAPEGRLKLINALRAALPPSEQSRVRLYGGCGLPDPCNRTDTHCKHRLISSSRFYFAAESLCCQGYITEKFRLAFKHDTVPLALGGLSRHDYQDLGVAANTFLHDTDFNSVQAMAARLLELDGNHKAYTRMLRAGRRHVLRDGMHPAFCQLCAIATGAKERASSLVLKTTQFVNNSRGVHVDSQTTNDWWYDSRNCRRTRFCG